MEKLRHEIDKLKDDKSREERKNKYAEEEKKNLQGTLADKELAIDKMREEKTRKDADIDTLNKKIAGLEAQLKEKSEKLAIKTAEFKKLEEMAG